VWVVGFVAVTLFGMASPARADLVLLGPDILSGQGLGAVLTAITLQSPDNETFEQGGVLADGSTFGDVQPGSAHSSTFDYDDLGITSADDLGLILNLSEPGSEDPPMVTADELYTITLQAWSSTGDTTPTSFVYDCTNCDLVQVAGGVGGSGLVFELDPTQTAALDAFVAANPDYVLSVYASFADATGGQDVIQAAQLLPTGTAIPEPTSLLLLGAGLALSARSLRKSA